MLQRIKFYLNNIINNPYWFFKVYFERLLYKVINQEIPVLNIKYLTPQETINYLVDNPEKSIARIGDGEIAVFLGGDIYFQKYSQTYKDEFLKMFRKNNKNLLIGIPAYESSSNSEELINKKINPSYWDSSKILFKYILDRDTDYGSYNISSAFRNDYGFISKLWKDKDVIIVGGVAKYFKDKKLKYAKKQILVRSPNNNAMSDLNNIFKNIKSVYKKLNSQNCVVLIGCGPCATILAYWLAKENITAYDLGHFFDINEGVW